SDLGYALDAAGLRRDPQALLYVAGALSDPGLAAGARRDAARARWIYVRTRGSAEVRPVTCEISLAEAGEGLEALDERVGRPVSHAAAAWTRGALRSALELEPNWGSACEAYGGCPHRSRCGPRPVSVILES